MAVASPESEQEKRDVRYPETTKAEAYGYLGTVRGRRGSCSHQAKVCLVRVRRIKREIYKGKCKLRHLTGNRNRNCLFFWWALLIKVHAKEYHKRQMVEREVETCCDAMRWERRNNIEVAIETKKKSNR